MKLPSVQRERSNTKAYQTEADQHQCVQTLPMALIWNEGPESFWDRAHTLHTLYLKGKRQTVQASWPTKETVVQALLV